MTFALAVGVEGFAYAFASIVLITYMSTLASVEHAASQFGLLTSLCAFPGSILAGFSGFVIEHTGFVWFFILRQTRKANATAQKPTPVVIVNPETPR